MFGKRVLALACVLAATAAACGGGSGKATPSSNGSPTTASSSGGSSSGAKSSAKTASDALVVAKVMASANFTSVQDNGGLATPNGFSSQATHTTATGVVTATLYSYDSLADAASGYSLFIPSSNIPPVAVPGLGDQAISLGNTIVVRKGAQVLDVSVQLNKASEDQIDIAKENGATFDAVSKAVNGRANRDLLSVTKTIAAKLSGAMGSSDLTYLPTGALDPCGIDTAKLESGDIKVTSAPAFSDTPPMSACIYTFAGSTRSEPGTGQLTLYTLTTAQGAAATPPVTPAQEYASTLTGYHSEATGGGSGSGSGGGADSVGSDTDGPLSIAGMKNGEVDFAALAQLPESPGDHITIRISSFRSSYVVDAGHCYDEITKMMTEELNNAHAGEKITSLIGDAAYDAAKTKIAEDVAAWCKIQEQSGKRAHGSDG